MSGPPHRAPQGRPQDDAPIPTQVFNALQHFFQRAMKSREVLLDHLMVTIPATIPEALDSCPASPGCSPSCRPAESPTDHPLAKAGVHGGLTNGGLTNDGFRNGGVTNGAFTDEEPSLGAGDDEVDGDTELADLESDDSKHSDQGPRSPLKLQLAGALPPDVPGSARQARPAHHHAAQPTLLRSPMAVVVAAVGTSSKAAATRVKRLGAATDRQSRR